MGETLKVKGSYIDYIDQIFCCCCIVVLRPRYISKVMSGRSVNLTTLFLGRLRPPKRLTSTSCTYFRQQLTTSLFEKAIDQIKYFITELSHIGFDGSPNVIYITKREGRGVGVTSGSQANNSKYLIFSKEK